MDNDNNASSPEPQFVPPVVGSEIKPTADVLGAEPDKTNNLDTGKQRPSVGSISEQPAQSSPETSPFAASSSQPDMAEMNARPTAAPSGPVPNPGKKNWMSKGVVGAALAAVLLIGGSAGAYFGIIAPNQPENVWERALSNTARGYDALLEQQGEQEELSSGKANGNYRIEAAESVFEGNFSTEYDKKVSKTTFDIGVMGSRINAELLTELAETSQYPDVYAKVDGLAAFQPMAAGTGLEGLITQVDGKWFVADRSLFEQFLQGAEDVEEPQVATEDAIALMKSVGEVNREYVFTTDTSKSIFSEVKFIGKEERNSRATHHYQVTPHKENTKAYIAELGRVIGESKIFKAYNPDGGSFDTSALGESIDRLSGTEVVDVWVDSTTKLLHAVRFNNQEKTDEYFEVGLKYTGGSEYPFYLETKAGNENVSKLQVTYKEDKNEIELDLQVDGEDINVTVKGTATFSNDTVTIEKPTDATPVMNLVQQLFGGGFMPTSTLDSSSAELSELSELQGFPLEADF